MPLIKQPHNWLRTQRVLDRIRETPVSILLLSETSKGGSQEDLDAPYWGSNYMSVTAAFPTYHKS